MRLTHDDLLVQSGALLLRCLLLNHPHSGQNNPPMFGDYEAQRHWQEVTVNLPFSQWYNQSADNDLQYWGLDYPPLTAYHSLFLGEVARAINPEFVELNASRGEERPAHKVFMRSSVLVADLLIFLPAALFFAKTVHPTAGKNAALGFAILALYPGLILVDNGHFQYNDVSLGLFVVAVTLIARGRDIWASVFFVCALNYKQMELYHALPFFCYLLGKCWRLRSQGGFKLLVYIGSAVIVTFAVIWIPFLGDPDAMLQVVRRIFPLARGVFEDKVANVWCSVNLVVKIKQVFDQPTLVSICLLSTLLASLPSNLHLLAHPTIQNFHLALINTSMAFFLLSFQVHEKSILLVAIPVALYAAIQTCQERYDSLMSCWFLLISTFSMFPLLLKDGLGLPSLVLSIFYLIGCNHTGFLDPVRLVTCKPPSGLSKRVQPISSPSMLDNLIRTGFVASLTGSLSLVLLNAAASSPLMWPDLWTVLISVYSCAHFVIFAGYFNYLQLFCSSPLKKLN